MPEYNGAMMQCFHWYTPADGTLWKQLAENAAALSEAGITALWLPPAYKGVAGKNGVGYGTYDLFDLGEFNQKGTVRTKYGTKDAYLNAIKAAQNAGMQVYADIVFNHKMGADHAEEFIATPYNPQNRNEPIGELQSIKAWTHFTFPGRKGKYSEFEWHWWHFTAGDQNCFEKHSDAIYLFEGKTFDDEVDGEKGNFDYLMGCDLDVNHDEVQAELYKWGEWYMDTCGVDGFRFDAVKHVKSTFFLEWLKHLRTYSKRKLFGVGEYWSGHTEALTNFIEETEESIMLFDAALHYNFAAAGKQGQDYDMQHIFDNTLVQEHPQMAVTLVSNHDTQPLQSLESVVEAWFKPLAYALILLRRDGYPCVFAADYYGARYKDTGNDGEEYEIEMASHQWMIDHFLHARKHYAYGDQYDYFDHPDCIGWIRTGSHEHPEGMAVIMSNGDAGSKVMDITSPNTKYIDLTQHINEPVVTDEEGHGNFHCPAGSVSVWVPWHS